MRNIADGKIIYTTSFSSLFQEWLETDEAKSITKGFENTFLLPYPLQPVEIEITLLDPRRNVRASMKHIVRPDDVLIAQKVSRISLRTSICYKWQPGKMY